MWNLPPNALAREKTEKKKKPNKFSSLKVDDSEGFKRLNANTFQ